ncbi:MAG: hypothetical protein HC840_22090 [Leptolyngbyaceae cyanobacterium RM2_2_4]|nr:hypothetical protein [Leptolyngbyaceae cyanobacterium SM1_4_3]NJO51663.1 hypothetical protein [Leptolyngbyaceae cyanobacterium RM2_2_4]
MKTMGKYCKAYLVKQLRQFDHWSEQQTYPEQPDEQTTDVNQELAEEDILYLQENYIVTNGVFPNENIVFDQVSPEWIDFCQTVLNFSVPD